MEGQASAIDVGRRRARARYPADVVAPGRARRLVEEFLARVGAGAVAERCDLLTSEVVTDAVRHAPSQVEVRVELDHDVVRVEVSDDPGLIDDPDEGRLQREIGRRFVRALARRWGSSFERDRTTTWFELDTR